MKGAMRAVFRYSLILVFCSTIISFSGPVERIDLYDSPGNHLMFVTFEYDQNGAAVARSVFAPDSTFLYRTIIKKNVAGVSQTEASFNFNNDTLWKASYGSDGKSLSVQDQFGNDQIGGNLKFSGTDQNVDIFQGTGLINKMSYEKNGEGSYNKVNVYDNAGALLYYVQIKYQGTGVADKPVTHIENASIKLNSSNCLVVKYNLISAASIRCEIYTLSGQHIATLFSVEEKAGHYRKTINLNNATRLFANGLYLSTLTIDNKRIVRQKLLVHNSAGGF